MNTTKGPEESRFKPDYRKAFYDMLRYIDTKDKHYAAGLRQAINIIKIVNDIDKVEIKETEEKEK